MTGRLMIKTARYGFGTLCSVPILSETPFELLLSAWYKLNHDYERN
jgi:hypothetical protein